MVEKKSHVEEQRRGRAKEGCGGGGGKKGADGHESDAKTFKNNAGVRARVLFYTFASRILHDHLFRPFFTCAAQTHDGVYVARNSLSLPG
jgi:hypothetical protein